MESQKQDLIHKLENGCCNLRHCSCSKLKSRDLSAFPSPLVTLFRDAVSREQEAGSSPHSPGNSSISPDYSSVLKGKVKVTPEGQWTTYSLATSCESQNCSRVLLSLRDHTLNLCKSEGWRESSGTTRPAGTHLRIPASSSE